MFDDAWLDSAETATRRRFQLVRIPAGLASTPGRLVAMMLVLTLALLAAGFSMSQSIAARQRALDTLITSTEPMAHSAHLLYNSLSQADTISTNAFVQPGLLTKEQMEAYAASIDRAAATAADIHEGAVTTVGGGAAAEATREIITKQVTDIQRDLPVYTGLMERAKVNQRIGNPVGVAYMTQASSVMRDGMLLKADQLSRLTQEEVAREMRRLSAPQWVPLSGLFAALGFLLAAQWALWRVFRRRLNKGFVAATAAIVIAVGWVSASNYQAWESGAVGFESAADPWQQLARARIEAQETRTDETLALLSRQSVTRASQSFALTGAHIRSALDAAESLGAEVDPARGYLSAWSQEHAELERLLADGRFTTAIDLVNGSTAYADLDAQLQKLIDFSRENTREFINASLDATRLVSTAVAGLTLFAVACIWAGIRPRLGEYYR